MILPHFTTLDLGDLGVHDALVEGEVLWRQTGPVGTSEGYCSVTITRITVNLLLGNVITVLDVTKAIRNGAKATLEEELEAKYLKAKGDK